jgi:hypothetical protein
MLLSDAHLLLSCRKTYATSYTRRLATYPALRQLRAPAGTPAAAAAAMPPAYRPRPSKPFADAASARWMRRTVW